MVILGQVPSKSNCYKVITFHGHGSLCKQDKLKRYEKESYWQCPHRGEEALPGKKPKPLITGQFRIDVDIFYKSMRSDLDNGFKVILDCLQRTLTIKNDDQCTEIRARKFVDKNNPRAKITIIPIDSTDNEDTQTD